MLAVGHLQYWLVDVITLFKVRLKLPAKQIVNEVQQLKAPQCERGPAAKSGSRELLAPLVPCKGTLGPQLEQPFSNSDNSRP